MQGRSILRDELLEKFVTTVEQRQVDPMNEAIRNFLLRFQGVACGTAAILLKQDEERQ